MQVELITLVIKFKVKIFDIVRFDKVGFLAPGTPFSPVGEVSGLVAPCPSPPWACNLTISVSFIVLLRQVILPPALAVTPL